MPEAPGPHFGPHFGLTAALLAGSTYVLLYTVLGVIPAHILNLRFFEERELILRYGESYERYRESAPPRSPPVPL